MPEPEKLLDGYDSPFAKKRARLREPEPERPWSNEFSAEFG
jgi:hypothetical protein